jgi:hypothetical protein
MHAYVMHILSRWVSDSCCREVNGHFNENSVMIFATHIMVDSGSYRPVFPKFLDYMLCSFS